MFFPHKNKAKLTEEFYHSPEDRAKLAVRDARDFLEISDKDADMLSSIIQRHITEGLQDFIKVQAKIKDVMESGE